MSWLDAVFNVTSDFVLVRDGQEILVCDSREVAERAYMDARPGDWQLDLFWVDHEGGVQSFLSQRGWFRVKPPPSGRLAPKSTAAL